MHHTQQSKGWVSAGRSAIGGGHTRRGQGGDDRHLIVVRNQLVYLAISDGAGGARHSASGAKIAVFAALDWLLANNLVPAEPLPERQLKRCFHAVHHRLQRTARAMGVRAPDLSATLLVAAIGEQGVLAGQVGDGALVLESEGTLETVLQDSKSGPVNRSEFVTDAKFAEALRIVQIRRAVSGVVGVTDGVEGLTISRAGQPNAAFYTGLIERTRRAAPATAAAELQKLLDSSAIRDRCDDDLTIAVVAKKGERHVP